MSLFKSIQKYKNKIALVDEISGPITYNRLVKESLAIKKNIPKKSLTFLISHNSVASIICYVSAIKHNNAVVLIDIKTNVENIIQLFNLYF